jgi:ketosteroid isomerase-like protein
MLITATATATDATQAAGQTPTAAPADLSARSADVAAIMTIVESVATYADRGEFEALERLYAPAVEVDYTSLAGGEPETKSAQALMTEWASVLPGFDRTRHAISDVAVQVDGARASAAARVIADHWIGAQHWQVGGRYEYRLARRERVWQITAHRFVLEHEQGTRDVFGPATEAARTRPVAYLVRRHAQQTVLDFLTGLETKDMARVNGVWAEDAVQEMPYVPAGFPSRVVGREALIRQYAAWPTVSGRARFTDGLRFYPTLDPSIVFVEYRGSVDVIPTGRRYEQRYGGLFHVQDGRITLFREYFDPRPFAHAFGLDEGRAFGDRD